MYRVVLLALFLPVLETSLYLKLNPDYPPFGCQNYGDCTQLSNFNPMNCTEGSCVCNAGYSGVWCETNLSVSACASNPCSGNRTCLSAGSNLYKCQCKSGFNGPNCSPAVSNSCTTYNPCGVNNTCTVTSVLPRGYNCTCTTSSPYVYGGADCTTENFCAGADKDCFYGAACQDDNTCMCTAGYDMGSCSSYRMCSLLKGNTDYGCVNGGTCSDFQMIWGNGWGTGYTDYSCKCTAGWTGDRCETGNFNFFFLCSLPMRPKIDECDSNPCLNGATCVDAFLSYSCICTANYEGTNCETIKAPCAPYTDAEGNLILSKCQRVDLAATCTVNPDNTTFTCTCTADYTNTLCDLTITSYTTLIKMYSPMDPNSVVPYVEQIASNDVYFSTTMTYQLATMSEADRMALSWDVSDIFNWIAYEDAEIDMNVDLFKRNDVQLGNCFTFNHRNLTFAYLARRPGEHGGIRTSLKIDSEEYLPYVEYSSINVYVHRKEEDIYYENIGYAPKSVGEALLSISKSSYQYIQFRGSCVSDANEVEPYYYERDAYSQEACYRSCYQYAVTKLCDCSDPLYAKADDQVFCNVSRQSCVETYRSDNGDPSDWGGCSICVLPCYGEDYGVVLSQGPLRKAKYACASAANVTQCESNYANQLKVSIFYSSLVAELNKEVYTMSFVQFLSQLGGLAGVICGLSVFGFLEFIVLILLLCRILIMKR